MNSSLSRLSMKKIDTSNMLELLEDFPDQCAAALEIAKQAKIPFEPRDFKNIVFIGMGGSAIGADLVRTYLYSQSKIPLAVCREYATPGYVDKDTLVFVVSYSGNTEETLVALRDVLARGSTIIALSSDGALKDIALKRKVAFVELPKGLPPRCAIGYSSIIPLCLLARLGIIPEVIPHINSMIALLKELCDKNLNPRIGKNDNIAKYTAGKLHNKFCMIYASSVHFDVCATRFRSQLAENTKALSSSHLFPEMTHNEVVGWENPARALRNCVAVLFRDKGTHERVERRMDIVKAILKKDGHSIIELWSRGEDLLGRIFSLIYIGDFISYYLAILYGVDPTPVEKVEYLKRELKKDPLQAQ